MGKGLWWLEVPLLSVAEWERQSLSLTRFVANFSLNLIVLLEEVFFKTPPLPVL